MLFGIVHQLRNGEIICRAFPAFLRKGPWPNWGKMIDLTAKLGEINDIEHNMGSKIFCQNQVILEMYYAKLLLMHICLSIILIWVIVSHK